MRLEKQGKGGRKAYLKDFYRTAGGEYLYCGKQYALHGCAESAFLLRGGLLSCGLLLFAVVSGLLAGPGMDRTVYVLLPYVLLIGASGSVVWAFFRLLFADRPVREYVYRGAVLSVPRRCVFTGIAAALRLAGQVAFLLIHGNESESLYIVADFSISVFVIAAAFLLRAFYRRADWRELPQPEPTKTE